MGTGEQFVQTHSEPNDRATCLGRQHMGTQQGEFLVVEGRSKARRKERDGGVATTAVGCGGGGFRCVVGHRQGLNDDSNNKVVDI